MTNGDRIRSMTDEELASFIFRWQVNVVSEVFKAGFVNVLNFADMKKWIEAESEPHTIFEQWEREV